MSDVVEPELDSKPRTAGSKPNGLSVEYPGMVPAHSEPGLWPTDNVAESPHSLLADILVW